MLILGCVGLLGSKLKMLLHSLPQFVFLNLRLEQEGKKKGIGYSIANILVVPLQIFWSMPMAISHLGYHKVLSLSMLPHFGPLTSTQNSAAKVIHLSLIALMMQCYSLKPYPDFPSSPGFILVLSFKSLQVLSPFILSSWHVSPYDLHSLDSTILHHLKVSTSPKKSHLLLPAALHMLVTAS